MSISEPKPSNFLVLGPEESEPETPLIRPAVDPGPEPKPKAQPAPRAKAKIRKAMPPSEPEPQPKARVYTPEKRVPKGYVSVYMTLENIERLEELARELHWPSKSRLAANVLEEFLEASTR